ncbi:MAG: MotA/TolQ/ExbB proton channel family protein [Planctomycetota bacterium]
MIKTWQLVCVVAMVMVLAATGGSVAIAQDGAEVPGESADEQSGSAGGVALRVRVAAANLWDLHKAGGLVMYFIDVALVIGVAFVLERLFRMRRRRILPNRLLASVNKALESGDYSKMQKLARSHRKSTLGKVLHYLSTEGRTADTRDRDETVNELASRDIDVHRMMCFPLAAIAGLAPLMGLLGTVAGIRESFRDVALAGEMGNPVMLAGGIEKALITTIYGLVVAIVTLFAYHLFKFRINLMANELEEAVSDIVRRHYKNP